MNRNKKKTEKSFIANVFRYIHTMRHFKLFVITFFAIQIYAVPMVKSCMEMSFDTNSECCLPSNCECDQLSFEISTDISFVFSSIEINPVNIVNKITFSNFFQDFSFKIEIIPTIYHSPPLKMEENLYSRFESYII